MAHPMRTLILALALVPAAALAAPEGSVAWRYKLDGPLTSQPAVSPEGRIAITTSSGLHVLDAQGKHERSVPGVTGQPMWAGERVWAQVARGWQWTSATTSGPLCNVQVPSAALDSAGNLVVATDRALETCEPRRRRLAARKGRQGLVFPLGDGWASADEWTIELIGADGKVRAELPVMEVGAPVAVTHDGLLLVTTPGGRLDAYDANGKRRWAGPDGADGRPVESRAGLLMLGSRAVSLVDPPLAHWSLPIAAGARAAVALDDGSVVVLERAGRLGLVRNGAIAWAKALKSPGQALGAHPSGLVLVEDGGQLVAFVAPPPDRGAAYPIAGGLARSWQGTPAPRASCGSTPSYEMRDGRLTVFGPGVERDGACVRPSIGTRCSKETCSDAGRVVTSIACGEGCAATIATDAIWTATDGVLTRYDAAGKALRLPMPPGRVRALGVDADGAVVLIDRGYVLVDRKGRATRVEHGAQWTGGLVLAGRVARANDANGMELSLSRNGVQKASPVFVRSGRSVRFGETSCFDGRCGDAAAPVSAVSFGDRLAVCGDGRSLCRNGAPVFSTESALTQLVAMPDGTTAVLAGTEVLGLWPDGSTWWSLAPETCEGETWMSLVSPERLAIRRCGRVDVLATGVAAKPR